MKTINNKGFTFIELLAVIILLSVVLSVSVSIALDIIEKTKEKTYEVTLKNIESNTSNYLLENKDRLFYIPNADNTEYQCITVRNLIDYGYLDNNVTESLVAKDTYVGRENYIYIERDSNTKAVTRSVYIKDNTSPYASICMGAILTQGIITFDSKPGVDEWAMEKTITITYKIRNLNDISTYSDYKYNYIYSGESTCINGCNDSDNQKKINVTSTGTVSANIKNGDNIIVTNSLDVSNIDRIKPVINVISRNTTSYNNNTLTLSLKLIDNESGINYDSFTKEDLVLKHNNSNITINEFEKNNNNSYTIKVYSFNWTGNLELTIDKDKFYDRAGNGNDVTTFKFANPGVCNDLTYNGTSQTLVANGSNVSYQNNDRTNAGTQTVTITSNTGYIFIDNSTSKTLSCTIAKRNITITATNQSKTYDGSPLDAERSWGTTGSIYPIDAIKCDFSGSQTDAGSSAKTITDVRIYHNINCVGNSCSTDMNDERTDNYNITKVNGTLTVNKASSTITCNNKTYTGSAQTIATCAGGTIKNANQTNAGSYTVTCTGDSNHSNAAAKVCSITNTPAVITCVDNIIYTGSAQTIATCAGGTIKNANQTNAGSYTVTCTGDSNHSNAAAKVCSITNTPAVITCVDNIIYTGSAQTIATCAGGTIKNANQTNAGSYTVTCTGDSNHSNAAAKVCSITNTPAVITCVDNIIYTGSAQTIATCAGGTIQNAVQTDPGIYTITCTGDSTHTNAAAKYCAISQKPTITCCKWLPKRAWDECVNWNTKDYPLDKYYFGLGEGDGGTSDSAWCWWTKEGSSCPNSWNVAPNGCNGVPASVAGCTPYCDWGSGYGKCSVDQGYGQLACL